MKNKRISMQTIADHLNISKVTVYKALNNQRYVSDELREQILQTAKDLGYIMSNTKSQILNNQLAFIVPKRYFLESDSFYTSIFYYINSLCSDDKITLNLCIIDDTHENDCIIPDSLLSSNCDGLFIAGEMSDQYISCLGDLNLPILLIDFYKPDLNYDCIIADNFFNGFTATNYLIEHGHRDIGFIGNPKQSSSISDRFYGYQKALASHGLSYRSEWHLSNNDPISGVYTLDTPLPETLPTAFVCHCDRSAYFLIQRLNMENIRVPEDISIISFDNTNLAENSKPKLTTIDISTKSIAAKSYAQLSGRLNNLDMQKQRIYISCNIVERCSVNTYTI